MDQGSKQAIEQISHMTFREKTTAVSTFMDTIRARVSRILNPEWQ